MFQLPEDEQQTKLAEASAAVLQANNKQQVAPLHPGVPATPLQIIFLALRMAGRINDQQSVSDSSADVDNAFSLLVMMLAQWAKARWLVFREQDSLALSTGAQSYTVGPSGDFNLATRPDKILDAYVRFGPAATQTVQGQFLTSQFAPGFAVDSSVTTFDPTQATDFPLRIVASREEYDGIAFKGLSGRPSYVFLDSNYPIGRVYVWPVPPLGAYEIHLIFKGELPVYGAMGNPLNLPPEYNEAIMFNLARRIVMLNGGEPSQSLSGMARAALQTVRVANVQMGSLQMPAAILPRRGGSYGLADLMHGTQ